MGVDKAGENHAPAEIEFFRFARFGKAYHAVSRSSRNDGAVAHQYGAIAHKTGISHRRTAPGNVAAKRKKLFAARDKKGPSHVTAIIAQKRGMHHLFAILEIGQFAGTRLPASWLPRRSQIIDPDRRTTDQAR
jgi:hypothetical protein